MKKFEKFIVEAIVNQEGEYVNPCGTDYCYITRDLKTLKGLLKRLEKMQWRKKVEYLNIYTEINSKKKYKYNYLVKDSQKMNF